MHRLPLASIGLRSALCAHVQPTAGLSPFCAILSSMLARPLKQFDFTEHDRVDLTNSARRLEAVVDYLLHEAALEEYTSRIVNAPMIVRSADSTSGMTMVSR